MAVRAHSTIVPFVTTKPSPFAGDSGEERQIGLSETARFVPLEPAPMSGPISRRTMITALSALPLVSAMRGEPMAQEHQPAATMSELIEAHRLARDEFTRLIELKEELEEQVPQIRVLVTDSIVVGGEPREEYAYWPGDIERWAQILFRFPPSPNDEQVRHRREAWIAVKRHQLQLSRRRYIAARKRLGLDVVEMMHDEADDREGAALLALILRRPTNQAEVLAKRQYFRVARVTAGEIGGYTELMRGIFEHFCTPI